jgi:hypothetical protein
MATPARTGALAAAASWTRAAAWAPDWRAAFGSALAREIEERRFFLWKKHRRSPPSGLTGVPARKAKKNQASATTKHVQCYSKLLESAHNMHI